MPFKPVLFKDLNKRNSDLLTKDFPSEKRENKVNWTGETSSNVSFETSLLQKADGSILGTFTPKYRVRDYNTTLTAELKTDKNYKVEAKIDDHFTPGLTTTVSAETVKEDIKATVGVEYKHELATFTTTVDYGRSEGSNLISSAVVGTQGFQLGAQFNYFIGSSNDSSLKEFLSTASYGNDEFDLGVYGKIINEKDSTILGANYFQRVNPDLLVGADVSFDTQNVDSKPKLTAGAQYRIDSESLVKTKFDTDGKLGVSFSQKFKTSKLVLAGTFDTNSLSTKNSSNVAFNLTLF
jgi:hypothetical protein